MRPRSEPPGVIQLLGSAIAVALAFYIFLNDREREELRDQLRIEKSHRHTAERNLEGALATINRLSPEGNGGE